MSVLRGSTVILLKLIFFIKFSWLQVIWIGATFERVWRKGISGNNFTIYWKEPKQNPASWTEHYKTENEGKCLHFVNHNFSSFGRIWTVVTKILKILSFSLISKFCPKFCILGYFQAKAPDQETTAGCHYLAFFY